LTPSSWNKTRTPLGCGKQHNQPLTANPENFRLKAVTLVLAEDAFEKNGHLHLLTGSRQSLRVLVYTRHSHPSCAPAPLLQAFLSARSISVHNEPCLETCRTAASSAAALLKRQGIKLRFRPFTQPIPSP